MRGGLDLNDAEASRGSREAFEEEEELTALEARLQPESPVHERLAVLRGPGARAGVGERGPELRARGGVARREERRERADADDVAAEILGRDVEDRLSNVPILLTWGLHDLMFTRPFMERFRQTFKLARVARLDAKHYIQEDAPKEIAEAIGSFLESSDVTRVPA